MSLLVQSPFSWLRRAGHQPLHASIGATDVSLLPRQHKKRFAFWELRRFRSLPAARALPDDWPEGLRALRLMAQGGQWLRYRSTRTAMADTLLRHGRTVEALEWLFEVWYIDLNGPRNALPPSQALLHTETPAFDMRRGATHWRVRRNVRHLMRRLGLGAQDVRTLFLAATTTVHRRHGLPLAPLQAWLVVSALLLD